MKVPNRVKMNNRGLTLLEVLVTIAIFAVVAVPLLNSFIVGMRVNNKARETEDAQQVAQNVAEAFDATDLNKLFEQMNVNGTVAIGKYENVQVQKIGSAMDDDKNSDQYQLTFNETITGDGNETYYVSATLKSTAADLSTIPEIVDVGKDSTSLLRVCEEYYKYDAAAQINGYDRKKTVFNITCDYEDNKYTYNVGMNVEFSKSASAGTETHTYNFPATTIAKEEGAQFDVFLLCDYFDLATALSTDKVEINYNFADAGTAIEMPCNIYLVGQNIQSGGHPVAFNKANITINKNGNTGMRVFTNVTDVTGAEITTVDSQNLFNIYQLEIQARNDSHSGEIAASVHTTITR